jgi:hypothetical protein
MMKDFSIDPDPAVVQLLDELEGKVKASAVLAEEWRQARQSWPGPLADLNAMQRFREWFLLERSSAALGAAPAAAWSPAEIGEPEDDPWARLLGSFFGIFRPVLAGEEAALQDLWTGRVILTSGELPDLAPDALLHGRVAPAGEDRHTLLPGWRLTAGTELSLAIADDLQRARAAQPRARLSQFECEHLWARPALPVALPPAAADPEAFLAELENLLRQTPGWPMERVIEVLDQDGADALLEQLAFETDLPLDPLRALLAELRAAALAQEQNPAAPAPLTQAELDVEQVALALERFDQERAAGANVQAAWTELEKALELADGSLKSLKAPWLEEGEPIGPSQLPGLNFWVDAWAWEMEQTGAAPRSAELAAARSFCSFVESLRQGPADAEEIEPKDLWAFLTSSPDLPTLQQRRDELASFLRWLRAEQAAPLPLEELESATSPSWHRLAESVQLNARNRSAAGRGTQAARVWKTAPIQVLTENQEGAPVLGFPEQTAALVRTGDTLAGRWESGSFRLCAWFPSA